MRVLFWGFIALAVGLWVYLSFTGVAMWLPA
jgi:hypothetical protein